MLTVKHNAEERMFTISDMNGNKSNQYYRSMEFYCHPDFISAEYSEECLTLGMIFLIINNS